MSGMFEVATEAYDRLVGRYSPALARELIRFAGVGEGMRALDVGCGPGALTAELAARLGAERVAAVEPSPPFAEACRRRVPGARVQVGAAEALPFADGEFDAALAQLVVHFMDDPVAGLREAGRVTRDGGVVAAHQVRPVGSSCRSAIVPGVTFGCARNLRSRARDGSMHSAAPEGPLSVAATGDRRRRRGLPIGGHVRLGDGFAADPSRSVLQALAADRPLSHPQGPGERQTPRRRPGPRYQAQPRRYPHLRGERQWRRVVQRRRRAELGATRRHGDDARPQRPRPLSGGRSPLGIGSPVSPGYAGKFSYRTTARLAA